MVSEISRITGAEARYMRVPTCNYEIGDFTVTRAGVLVIDGRTDSKMVEQVLEGLEKAGFTFEHPFGLFEAEAEITEAVETQETTVEADNTEDEIEEGTAADAGDEEENSAEENASESQQECVELTVESLPIEVTDTVVSFPWFAQVDAQDATAYTHFISALCEMAKTQKRIAVKEKEVENEKYTFRCFLLRLGFIGGEYKMERKVLLRNLTGSSAFKGGARHEVSE